MSQNHDCAPDDAPPKTSLKSIFSLAWPQTLMMLAHFCVGFVDVLVASRLGKDVQAAQGMVSQSMMFFMILAIATSNGTVAAVGQSLGACLYERTRRYIGLSCMLALGFSLVILAAGYPLRGQFILALQTPENVADILHYLLSIYLLIIPFYYLMIITNSVFRAYKWVNIPLYSMTLLCVVNTFLDLGLGLGMFGLPKLGYQGLALATFAAVVVGASFNIIVLNRRKMLTRKSIPPLRWIKRAAPYIFSVGWPSGLMQVLWQTGYLVLFAITASLPLGSVDALAGMTAGLRVEALLFLPGFAFNMTASILVGHELGAGRPDEAKRVGYRILGLGCGVISLLGVVVWIFAEPISGMLSADKAVQAHAMEYLFYNILAIPFTVASMILGGIMVGAGATLFNVSAFGVSTWLVRLPLAYLLGHIILKNSVGVWAAMLVSQVCQSLLMLYFFQFKDWRRFTLRKRKNGSKQPKREDT